MPPPFRVLGHDHGVYYYLAAGAQQVTPLTPPQHAKSWLMRLAPLAYWEAEYAGKRGADWDAAANALIQEAHTVGIFDPERIRGRGAWRDHDCTVVHLGDQLLVDGYPRALTQSPNGAVYPLALAIPYDSAEPLTAREASVVLDICRLPTWSRAVDGTLLAGWCAIAPICGALAWRPHLWVTGGRGTGKSTIYRDVVEPLVGPLALNPAGGSSEAGIRQELGHDARPVLFDEAEGQTRKTASLMEEIIALMRGASTETQASILKGTSPGRAMSFRVRSCFGLFSIGVSATQSADTSRITVLSLAIDHSKSRQEREAHYQSFRAQVGAAITPAFCQRFRARMVRLIPVIRQSAEAFAAAWAMLYGDRRTGDQVGAILAGAWACRSDVAITEAEAAAWLPRQDWSEEAQLADELDERRCLKHLLQSTLLVDASRRTRTVAELLERVAQPYGEGDGVTVADAADTLRRAGLAYDAERAEVRIASNHAGVAALLKDTPWHTHWARVLRRLPDARWEGRMRFTGPPERYVGLPAVSALGHE